MNGTDVSTNTHLAVTFPLPFQILALVGFAILGWATNLHGLDVAGIDVISSLDLRTDVNNPLPAHYPSARQSSGLVALYGSVYRIFIAYASLYFTSWIAYRYTTHGDAKLVDVFGYIPGMAALSLVCILLCPYNILHKTERRKFLQAVQRCLLSSSDSPVYFSDVVLADIFTSFAQVIGDVWLSLCMLIPGHSILNPTAGVGLSFWILPTVMSFPSLVRLRQCVIEYNHKGNTHRRPLYNALKYATAFPVIYLSAAQRLTIADASVAADQTWYGERPLFRLWLLAAMVNSLYSFWWDVTNDWGFDLLRPRPDDQTREPRSPPKRLVLPDLHSATPLQAGGNSYDKPNSVGGTPRSAPEPLGYSKHYQPYGLRATLHFPPLVYYALIILNLVLRLTWSMKILSVLNINSAASIGNFCLKAAEIFRRWLWVFIRVEWELIKKGQDGKYRIDDDETEYELILSDN